MGPISSSRQLLAILIFMGALFSCITDKVSSTNADSISPTTDRKHRNPRIFFPLTTSTSTVTYTADIWTVCFRTSTGTLTACNRKKRMINRLLNTDDDVIPSKTGQYDIDEKDDLLDDIVDGGIKDAGEDDLQERAARFLLYWTTITKTTSIT